MLVDWKLEIMCSGINVGTVSEIQLVTDTSVVVRLLIQRRTKIH
jgi:phospholipid/cholesterol/gamma-HCH transport system substrate-binding protein